MKLDNSKLKIFVRRLGFELCGVHCSKKKRHICNIKASVVLFGVVKSIVA